LTFGAVAKSLFWGDEITDSVFFGRHAAFLRSELRRGWGSWRVFGCPPVAALAPKRLLLIAGENDIVTPPSMNHLPLVDALRTAGAGSLAEKIIKTADHSFSGSRIALAREVTDWLERTCHARGAQGQ